MGRSTQDSATQGRPLQGLLSAEPFYLKNLVSWHLSEAVNLVCIETTLLGKKNTSLCFLTQISLIYVVFK